MSSILFPLQSIIASSSSGCRAIHPICMVLCLRREAHAPTAAIGGFCHSRSLLPVRILSLKPLI